MKRRRDKLKKKLFFLICFLFATMVMGEDIKNKLLLPVKKNQKYGYIDIKGNIILEFRYDMAREFSEGYAPVKMKGKWGYIDQTGKIVIKYQYDDAYPFFEDIAAVKIKRKWGYIDQMGEFVADPKYTMAWSFVEGMAKVNIGGEWDEWAFSGGKYGFVDKTGKEVIKIRWDNAENFSESLALVSCWDKDEYITEKGFINKAGEMVIEESDSLYLCTNFSEGLARVRLRETWKCGYIDKTGQIIIEPQFDGSGTFREGLARIFVRGKGKNVRGKYGYINKQGEIVITPHFDSADCFQCGLACVRDENDMWGYINKSDEIVIEPIFNQVGSFSNGVAWVHTGGEEIEIDDWDEWRGGSWYLINIEGNYIWEEPDFRLK